MAEQTRHELSTHHSGTKFIECADVSEIPDEGVIAVNVSRQPIALAKSDGKIFAVDNRCPHMGYPHVGGGFPTSRGIGRSECTNDARRGITLSRGACTDGPGTSTNGESCTSLTPWGRSVRGQPG